MKKKISKAAMKRMKQKASEWSDPEKETEIKQMMQDLKKLVQIKKTIFPNLYLKEAHYVEQIILKVLECDNWIEFLKLRENLRIKKECAQEEARKDVFARDQNSCVLTGKSTDLYLYYIDGDHSNNAQSNLVTLSREPYSALTHGVNALGCEMIPEWAAIHENYSNRLKTRLELLKDYVGYLQNHGFSHACLECRQNYEIFSLYAVPSPTQNRIELTQEHIQTYRKEFEQKTGRQDISKYIWVKDEHYDAFMEMLFTHGIDQLLAILNGNLRENPTDIHILNLLADGYLFAQKYDESYASLKQIFEIDFNNGLAQLILTHINAEQEHYEHLNLSSFTNLLENKEPTKIRLLKCAHNQFQTFAGFPREMPVLTHLDLSGNKLASCENFPQDLPKLRILDLNANNLPSLPPLGTIAPNLLSLNISHNQIQFLGDLSALSKLTVLDLSSNKLTSLEGFPPVLHGAMLNLSNNNLENFRGLAEFSATLSETLPHYYLSGDIVCLISYGDNPLRSFYGVPRNLLPSIISPLRSDHNNWVRQFFPRGLTLIKHCLEIWSIRDRTSGNITTAWEDAFDALFAYYRRSPVNLATSYVQDHASLTEEECERLKHEGGGTVREYLMLHLPPSDPMIEAITARLTVSLKSGYSIVL